MVLFVFFITGNLKESPFHVVSQLSHSCACSAELDTMVFFIIVNAGYTKYHTTIIFYLRPQSIFYSFSPI